MSNYKIKQIVKKALAKNNRWSRVTLNGNLLSIRFKAAYSDDDVLEAAVKAIFATIASEIEMEDSEVSDTREGWNLFIASDDFVA